MNFSTDDLGNAMLGVDLVEFEIESSEGLDQKKSPEEWRVDHESSLQEIIQFLSCRDLIEVLARSSSHQQLCATMRRMGEIPPSELEEADVEILHAIALEHLRDRRIIPASPNNMARLWKSLNLNVASYLRMQPYKYSEDHPDKEYVIRKIRLQTVYYRRNYRPNDVEKMLGGIFGPLAGASQKEVGVNIEKAYKILLSAQNIISLKYTKFMEERNILFKSGKATDQVRVREFFDNCSSLSKLLLSRCRGRSNILENKALLFQISEMSHSWIYTFNSNEITGYDSNDVEKILDIFSFGDGDKLGRPFEHIYLDNPIWERPFIKISNEKYFCPNPAIIYSFPFLMIERLIKPSKILLSRYFQHRTEYLEKSIYDVVRSSLPSARVFRSVMWSDPDTGREYENDVVALCGNIIFIFEAKSGRLDPVARRGGYLSIERNFRDIFIDPAIQASRLEHYLNKYGVRAKLWEKETLEIVELNLQKPKVVLKFSICLESFMSLTNSRHYFKKLKMLSEEHPWSPVLSLGELSMAANTLSTEISFFHYLTRRAKLEEFIDFEGDEQDLLSLYLYNRFLIDSKEVEGKVLRFYGIDNILRIEDEGKTVGRLEPKLVGVPVGPYWNAVVSEIYKSDQRHKFDCIEVILNQHLESLTSVRKIIQNFRRGLGQKNNDIAISQMKIVDRTFLLAVSLCKSIDGPEEWIVKSRTIAVNMRQMFQATDVVVIGVLKKSRSPTFDAISFFRYENNLHARSG